MSINTVDKKTNTKNKFDDVLDNVKQLKLVALEKAKDELFESLNPSLEKMLNDLDEEETDDDEEITDEFDTTSEDDSNEENDDDIIPIDIEDGDEELLVSDSEDAEINLDGDIEIDLDDEEENNEDEDNINESTDRILLIEVPWIGDWKEAVSLVKQHNLKFDGYTTSKKIIFISGTRQDLTDFLQSNDYNLLDDDEIEELFESLMVENNYKDNKFIDESADDEDIDIDIEDEDDEEDIDIDLEDDEDIDIDLEDEDEDDDEDIDIDLEDDEDFDSLLSKIEAEGEIDIIRSTTDDDTEVITMTQDDLKDLILTIKDEIYAVEDEIKESKRLELSKKDLTEELSTKFNLSSKQVKSLNEAMNHKCKNIDELVAFKSAAVKNLQILESYKNKINNTKINKLKQSLKNTELTMLNESKNDIKNSSNEFKRLKELISYKK